MKELPWMIVLGVIVLAFFVAIYFAARSWGKMGPGKRVAGLLLLAPHFLLLACIVVSLLNGHPPQGSPGFSTQFICGVLIVFILPVPALVGTVSALVMFSRAQLSS
jgi:hypothetical protein